MHHHTFAYILSVALSFLGWKIAAVLIASPVLPSPEAAFKIFLESTLTLDFWNNFGISAYRVILSIILAWLAALPVGIAIGYSSTLDKILSPIVFMTYPIPKIVLLPIILMLFGLGNISKIILIGIILFFQILVATRDGVKAIDKKYFDSLLSIGATDWNIVKEVALPAALPHSFTALRISTGTAISVLFFVESFATTSGLGYMIMDSWAKTAYTDMFTGIIGMSILGLILYETFRCLETRICAWQNSGKKEETSQKMSYVSHIISKTVLYGRMIKFSHTIFAIPFALATVVLAYSVAPLTLSTLFWIVMAMVGARSAAMGFNRLADATIDQNNPRTSQREIPAGEISHIEAVAFITVSALLFIVSAAMLSRLCFMLSFPALGVFFIYSYTKRFTWFSHIVLGIAIGLVPIAVWIAMTGTLSWQILVLSLALLTYIAGFDILYACQDADFDRQHKLFSIPAIFGIKKAMTVSALFHLISFLSLISLYWLFTLGPVYLFFTLLIAIAFLIEHYLVKPEDLSKINIAFYHMNSVIAILVFIAVLAGKLAGRTYLWITG